MNFGDILSVEAENNQTSRSGNAGGVDRIWEQAEEQNVLALTLWFAYVSHSTESQSAQNRITSDTGYNRIII